MSDYNPQSQPPPEQPAGIETNGTAVPSARRRPPGPAPVVTYTLLGVTVAVYLMQMVSPFLFNGTDLPAAIGLKINEAILKGQIWRLITPVLLHGSILHIGFNMYVLYKWGPELERVYGRQRYILLYFLAGFSGNVMSFLFTPAPSLGSSTAIFGLLSAQAVFFYQNRGLFGQYARRALAELVMLAGINLFIGLSPGIDNWGHIGGLIGGALFAWFAGPLLHVEGIHPAIRLVDTRERGDVWRSALRVALLFAALVIFNFYLHLGVR